VSRNGAGSTLMSGWSFSNAVTSSSGVTLGYAGKSTLSPIGTVSRSVRSSAMHTKRDWLLPRLPERAIVTSQPPRIRGILVLGANKLVIQSARYPAPSEPDGPGIHIGLRSAGRKRHRRPDFVCDLMDNAARASPGPAAFRRERGPSCVVRQVSGRGGKIVFRCSPKQTRRYNRVGRYLCLDKPDTSYVIATGCGGRRLCVSHHYR
jgi:hypothetical protein